MSAFFLAFNPEIFPDPYEFRPQRWLDAWEKGVKLGRFLPTFSKGTRGCLGMKYVSSSLISQALEPCETLEVISL